MGKGSEIEFEYDVHVNVKLRFNPELQKAKLVACRVFLDEGICDGWKDAKGMPNKEGSNAITKALCCGLANNIHAAKFTGFKNDSDHLREIISELENQFVATGEVIEDIYRLNEPIEKLEKL